MRNRQVSTKILREKILIDTEILGIFSCGDLNQMNHIELMLEKYLREGNYMQKGKKSESNAQQVNIGTKRTEPSDKNKGVKQEKRN